MQLYGYAHPHKEQETTLKLSGWRLSHGSKHQIKVAWKEDERETWVA